LAVVAEDDRLQESAAGIFCFHSDEFPSAVDLSYNNCAEEVQSIKSIDVKCKRMERLYLITKKGDAHGKQL